MFSYVKQVINFNYHTVKTAIFKITKNFKKYTKNISKTIKPYFWKSFSLKNTFGNVTVTETDKNEVSVIVEVSSESDNVKEIINNIEIDENSSSIF